MKRLSVLLLVSMALLATACGDDDDEGAGTIPSTTSAEDRPSTTGDPASGPATGDPINVGVIGPVSNTATAPLIEQLVGGFEAYFGHLNEEEGGIDGRPIELVVGDDNLDPNTALTIATRQVEEDDVVAFGLIVATPSALAVTPYAEEVETPILSAGSGLLSFTTPTNPYVFSSRTPNELQGAAVARFLMEEEGVTNMALTSVTDTTGQSYFQGFRAFGEENGAEVASVLYERAATEHSAQIRELVDLQPEAVFCADRAAVCANIIRGTLDLGLETTWVVATAASTPQLVELLGADAEGVYGNSEYLPTDSDDPSVVEFNERMERYAPGVPVTGFAQSGYVTARAVADALALVAENGEEPTGATVAAALEQLVADYGMMPPFELSADNHLMNSSLQIVQFQGGNLVTVGDPVELDPSEFEPLRT